MALAIVIVLIWFAGLVASVQVLRSRAGIKTWSRIKVFGRGGYGPGWVMWSAMKGFFWPVTLVVWLATGRPEPRVVFNEKAAQRKLQHGRS